MKKVILIILCITLIGGGIFIYFKYFRNTLEEDENKPSIIGTIEEYGYTLRDKDTVLFKNEFNDLREVLKESTVDYEAYATHLAKMFVIDFYTLNNKINKYDVGSLEYVAPSIKANFELKALDTIYKYVEDNSANKRHQDLPEVKSINILGIDMDSFYEIDETEEEAIVVSMEWDYVKDYGYDKKGSITFIKIANKLVVVDFETGV